MSRVFDQAPIQKIVELLSKINLGIYSMVNDYSNLYSDDEINNFKNIYNIILNEINKLESNNYVKEEVESVLKYEEYLKPYAFRCFKKELDNGYKFISWFKEDKAKFPSRIVSSTFWNSGDPTFCDSKCGINYEVSNEGFLGAFKSDAATLIQDKSQESIYTIGKTMDGSVINSYNLITPVVTPIQVFDRSGNDLKSKHNEIVLDRRYIKPVSVVYIDEDYIDIATKISESYNIPVEYIKNKQK